MIALEFEILDALPCGVLAVDAGNTILYLNPALAGLFGIEREQWLNRSAAELAEHLLPALALPELFRGYAEWSADAGACSSQPLAVKKGETSLYLREDSGPLRDPSGALVGRWFSYLDVSRERGGDQRKSEFVSVATHELRTPMTSIKGSVDLILSGFVGEITPETRELLELAQKSCERLTRLINNMLDLEKIEAGKMKLAPAAVDLRPLAEYALRAAKSLADPRGILLALESPRLLPTVYADPDRIEQVLTNLLSNAIKFSPDNAQVRIELSASDGWVQCSVSDQGCGIAPENLEKIFGKFQQVSGRSSTGGTGLGLAISRALVLEHKGTIWVESQLGQGARFIFRLPALPARAP